MTGLPLQLLLYVVVITSVIWYSIPQSQAGATPDPGRGREAKFRNDISERIVPVILNAHPESSK